ncbi:MAG TPA: hypothetical protein VFH78_08135, partial [Candidatus Thermoplasmatota archaeon]|nr:hypothetical protein [Candidatus Thermoplasmatota archaeon]
MLERVAAISLLLASLYLVTAIAQDEPPLAAAPGNGGDAPELPAATAPEERKEGKKGRGEERREPEPEPDPAPSSP